MEWKAKVFGKVQGVFFRKTVQEYATAFSILGYAKNLSDGTVEIVAQGTKSNLEAFVAKIKNEPRKAVIHHIEAHFSSPKTIYTEFSIL